jgi:hypothetical protein
MTRGQRRAHAWAWALGGPLALAGLVWLLLSRPAPVADAAAPTSEAARP